MRPVPPAAQMSSGATTNTPKSASRIGGGTGVQAPPVKWSAVPWAPTAQASPLPEPTTLVSSRCVPLNTDFHDVPSKWKVLPSVPTAQTSRGPLPPIDVTKPLTFTLVANDQAVPSQW